MLSVTITRHPVSTLTPAPAVPALERLQKMNARIEKNRKHFASLVAVTIGIVMGLLMRQLNLISTDAFMSAMIAWAVIMIGRSVVIESGFRRSPSHFEKKLDQAACSFSRKHLGLVPSSPNSVGEDTAQVTKQDAEQAAGGKRRQAP